jgi:hypothetical protein
VSPQRNTWITRTRFLVELLEPAELVSEADEVRQDFYRTIVYGVTSQKMELRQCAHLKWKPVEGILQFTLLSVLIFCLVHGNPCITSVSSTGLIHNTEIRENFKVDYIVIDWEDLECSVVICRVCRTVKVLELFVVTSIRYPIKSAINMNLVSSHSHMTI